VGGGGGGFGGINNGNVYVRLKPKSQRRSLFDIRPICATSFARSRTSVPPFRDR
jgi:hypothetical protein